jgi:hypothetical protein
MNESDPDMKPEAQREEALFQAAAQLNGPKRAVFVNGALPRRSRLAAAA